MKLPSPGFLLNALLKATRRFPGTMLCAAIGVFAIFVLIDGAIGKQAEQNFIRIWMTSQLGLAFLTGLVAFAESRVWESKRSWLLQAGGLLALVLYCWTLDPKEPTFDEIGLPQYLVLMLVVHLFVAVAPYLNRISISNFWEYNRQLFANIVVGGVFTLILYAGLALALLAVDQLFNLDISERIFMKLFVLLAGIFNTAYFLYHFPEKYEYEEADAGYSVVFKNLCKYILIPIVGLYFLILYAYGAKILMTWSLPKGWVSSLVLGFSVAGIFTYLLNYYLPKHDDSAWVGAYRRWFWWVQLPLTALLFVAIARRIGDYGVTEPRFLVAHLGMWLAVTCLYFLISKNDNIKFIPISLGVFALLFAFGPFSAFKVSKRSQTEILRELLEKNGRWANGRMISDTTAIPLEESKRINSALNYLEHREALRNIPWLPMPLDSFPNPTLNAASRIAAWAGISRNTYRDRNFINVHAKASSVEAIEISGFDKCYRIENFDQRPVIDGDYFLLSADKKRLEWKRLAAGKTVTVESFDLQPAIRRWTGPEGDPYRELLPGEEIVDMNGLKGDARLVIRSASLDRKDSAFQIRYMEGLLFLKENGAVKPGRKKR